MQKRIEIDANSILKLICHYLQDHKDRVPLDAELVNAGVSPYLQRFIMLEAKSDKWDDVKPAPGFAGELHPLHVRYEGKKVMSWGNDHQQPVEWRDSVETPAAE